MLSLVQAVVLGVLQGVTELFPISSLGHSVLLPHLFSWHIDQTNPQFLAFLVATHFGTALVLLMFFWQDWLKIISGIFRSLYQREVREDDTYAKIGWLLVTGTIPAGILGILLQTQLQALFGSALLVAAALAGNGVMLFVAERLRARTTQEASHDDAIAKLSYTQALGVGAAQAIALIPGFSRTGAAIAGGLLAGLSHENAARFGFLLATPIIFAAAVLNAPQLIYGGSDFIKTTLLGACCAAIAAYISVRFLTEYFKTKTLTPFAVYCFLAGVAACIALVR
ncbi:MAG: undecaprenyl-diphosphate phosphatase [Candidatus Pacebacteria bacterium]|nr:undecaprenyl-diphosphate phosphatase [Candidatus Paceibacterota bacterium]